MEIFPSANIIWYVLSIHIFWIDQIAQRKILAEDTIWKKIKPDWTHNETTQFFPPTSDVFCFALTYFLPKCKTGIVLSQQIGVLLSDNDLHQQNISYLDVILLYKNGNWEKILDYRWSWWNWKPNNILHLLIQFSWTEVSTVYIYLGLCVSASCLEIFVLP